MSLTKNYITIFILSIFAFLSIGCSSVNDYTKKRDVNGPIVLSNTRVALGMQYLKEGKPQLAKRRLLDAVKDSKNNPAAWYALGYYYETVGKINEAENSYLMSIRLAPGSGVVRNNYGTYLCRHKRYRESIKQFELAIDDPKYVNDAETYENAGICSLMIPDKKLAKHYFRLALREDPSLDLASEEFHRLSDS